MATPFTIKPTVSRPQARRASTEDKIKSAASRNTELLQLLACTDSAKPSFKQKEDYIRQLEGALAKNAEDVKRLTANRETEEKEYHDHHDTVMKRLALRISGKAAKEDKQHFDARKSLINLLESGLKSSCQVLLAVASFANDGARW